MKHWLVKVRRYGGGESVVDHYDRREDAEFKAKYMNEGYQTDTYYVEEFNEELLNWPMRNHELDTDL